MPGNEARLLNLQHLARQQLQIVVNILTGIQITRFRLVHFDKGRCVVLVRFNLLKPSGFFTYRQV